MLIECLVPTEKVIQVRNGKKINKERVYFPGYVMIEANLSGEIATYNKINNWCNWIFR